MTLRVLVVDDEPLARARLVRMLARIPDVEVVDEAGDGRRALAAIAEHDPDLLLLDIDMPETDGITVAESPEAPPVIFTTAHAQYATWAFDVDAVDYLLKPIIQEKLVRALDKARRRLSECEGPVAPERAPPRPDAPASDAGRDVRPLAVHEGGKVRFFDPRRVTRFRAEAKYTSFFVDGEEHLVKESLVALEQRLAAFGFVRVHRAELVRVDAVTALEPEAGGALVHLNDGQVVSVSRRFVAPLKEALRVG